MLPAVLLALALAALPPPALAAKSDIGGYCEYAAVHLDVATLALNSGCVEKAFCNENDVCQAKGCRRDEYPLGYAANDTLPARCPDGYVCPDEMDACQEQVGPGEACQLDRDDECAPPPNAAELKSSLNVNGSICLNQVCTYDNVTVGQPCELENLVFVGWTDAGEEFPDIRSRDNCRFGAYCDGSAKLCVKTKNVGDACSADKECASYNCATTGRCVAPSFAPRSPHVWVYVVVALAIVLLIVGTGIGLFLIHRRSRESNQIKLEQYYSEQVAYRQSLFTLGQTRDSLLSLPKGTSRDGARQSLLVGAGRDGGTQPSDGRF